MNDTSTHYVYQSKYFDDVCFDNIKHIDDLASAKELDLFLNFLGLDQIKDLRILEIGAGTGRYTIHLLSKGAKVTATEISQSSINQIINQAKAIGHESDLVVIKDDLERPIFENEFDLVFCVNLLHHVENMSNVFINMYKAVKPNCIVAIIEPNPLNPLFYFDFFRKSNWQVEKGILKCTYKNLGKLFINMGMTKFETKKYILIPNFIIGRFKFLLKVNEFLLRVPGISKFYMFHMMYGVKNNV